MNMYNVEEADLIQVVRRSKKRTASAAVAATTAPTRIKNEEGAKGKENDQPIQKEVADTTAQCDNEAKEDNKKGEKKKEEGVPSTVIDATTAMDDRAADEGAGEGHDTAADAKFTLASDTEDATATKEEKKEDADATGVEADAAVTAEAAAATMQFASAPENEERGG